MTPNSYQPLRPWEVPEHLGYYVGVDKTEDAFAEFERQISDPESLMADGRLVVVLGGQGCGKTSLIHRCTDSVRRILGTLDVTPVIVNLTREGMLSDEIQDRMSHVCSGLIERLDIEDRLDRSTLDKLSRKNSPVDVYRYLSGTLQRKANNGDDMVVVVLLPPSELVDEIIRYAKLVYPRLLFFAESSYVNEHSGWQSKLGSSLPAPPIRLAVGVLQPDDGFLFADARLRPHRGDGKTPSVSKATMRELQKEKPDLTIGQLQRLLCGVYGELLRQPTPVPEEVTIQHIKDYYFNHGLD